MRVRRLRPTSGRPPGGPRGGRPRVRRAQRAQEEKSYRHADVHGVSASEKTTPASSFGFGQLQRRTLRLAELVRLVAEVGGGLDALHRREVVHRDVKPSNIMLRADGSAALTDFGLAKGKTYTLLTRPGQIMGTLDYLAPELIRGEEATPATDVYALGCVAFECLTGRPPFADRSLLGVGTAHLADEPPDPPAPRELSWALLRALEKDPDARPPSATAYAHLLRAAATD